MLKLVSMGPPPFGDGGGPPLFCNGGGPPLFCNVGAGDFEFYASTMYRTFASMYIRMAVEAALKR